MIVIDSSAVVMFLVDGGAIGREIRARVAQEDTLHAPHLLDTEVASALLGMARGTGNGTPKLDRGLLDEHIRTYSALRIDRHEAMPLLPRVRVLHANVSASDTTYVALAETLGIPFVTVDARIKRGIRKPRCLIEVIGAEHA
ncbi:VapC toxin family PIN domain ribonuclease [Streptomyces sp. 3MP-14]|uniref:VapC toxin family PIN domain ribonuclease n=1 Tax=Streptomyces mimosae TaxID=2586635 RepID=A0A5N6A8Z3_9ACTN|nr:MULTISPECIES: type II toxin-antitoxin system VapC family toxin [Streptomyces]KAB8165284.1 VapC toxin family PIN domain ribonuclease [Streptomyces mimosae]KAB8175916.1 VapC toxin family PIN domain ribonuclease [Streptomyces sp. 3MP-14]